MADTKGTNNGDNKSSISITLTRDSLTDTSISTDSPSHSSRSQQTEYMSERLQQGCLDYVIKEVQDNKVGPCIDLNLPSGSVVYSPALPHTSLSGHARDITCLTTTPDSKMLISGDSRGAIKCWDAKGEQHLYTLTDEKKDSSESASSEHKINHLAVTANDILVSATLNKMQVWDLDKKTCLATLQDKSNITSIAYLPPKTIASASSEDGKIRIWNIETKDCKLVDTHLDQASSFHGLYLLTPLPDGRLAFTVGGYGKSIGVINPNDSYCSPVMLGSTNNFITSLTVIPNSPFLISGDGDPTGLDFLQEEAYAVKIWDTENNSCKYSLRGHTSSILSCTALPNDNGHFAVSTDSSTIKIWNLKDGECLLTLPYAASIIAPLSGNRIAMARGKNIQILPLKTSNTLQLSSEQMRRFLSACKHNSSATELNLFSQEGVSGKELITLLQNITFKEPAWYSFRKTPRFTVVDLDDTNASEDEINGFIAFLAQRKSIRKGIFPKIAVASTYSQLASLANARAFNASAILGDLASAEKKIGTGISGSTLDITNGLKGDFKLSASPSATTTIVVKSEGTSLNKPKSRYDEDRKEELLTSLPNSDHTDESKRASQYKS